MRVSPALISPSVAAERLAMRLLHDDPMRLAHVRSAALAAADLTRVLKHPYAADIVAAAWLHDIGYSPGIDRTGFHPLDGALYLAGQGWPDRIVMLVAHHSYAALMAPYFSVDHLLSLIDHVPGTAEDVLAYADLIAGHDGTGNTPQQRIEEMRNRHDATQNVPLEIREIRYKLLTAAADKVHTDLRQAMLQSA